MKHYKHLKQEQRYQISSLWKTTISQSKIYRNIGVDKSTISGEIKRNKGKRGYANQDRRVQIKHRVDIDHCPLKADRPKNQKNYEGDTVVGKGHKDLLVTLVDRATRETIVRALKKRKLNAYQVPA